MTDRPTGTDRPATTGDDRLGTPGQGRPTTTDHPVSDRPRLVTLAEAATLIGQTTEAIRSRIRRGTLRAVKGNHGTWMVHADELETGRPTISDRPADHSVTPSRPAETTRPTHEETALRDRLTALEATLTAERLDRAAERLETAERHGAALAEARERAGRAEALEEAARDARKTAEDAAARAEVRADALAAELREARRPWLERLARAIRGER